MPCLRLGICIQPRYNSRGVKGKLSIRWVGNESLEKIARARWLSFGSSEAEWQKFPSGQHQPRPAADSAYLLVEENGTPVGTATSHAFQMWLRGGEVPCQGVAYVGASKTHRRRGAKQPGIASAVMKAVLDRARERGDVVSALMPFRASFYEHFGYGIVETRAVWTIPLSILPSEPGEGWEACLASDRNGQGQCHQRQVESGQCEIERSDARWAQRVPGEKDGLRFVRRVSREQADAHLHFMVTDPAGSRILNVTDWGADSPAAFRRMLAFLGSLKDQYSSVVIGVSCDWPIHLLLQQSHVNRKAVQYVSSQAQLLTRMQLRVLDHRRFLELLQSPASAKGRATVAVREPEGQTNVFKIEVHGGKAKVSKASAEPGFRCDARTWAAVACGEILASTAVKMGIAEGDAAELDLLNGLAIGPRPYCHEYF